jgi:ribonuclease-3
LAQGSVRLKGLVLRRATPLERILGLKFGDLALLDQALTHPSYINEAGPSGPALGSYERLEFLGDAVLGAAVTMELFNRCPDLPEGQLTKLRSSLVSGRTLARVARGLQVGQHLKLGRGEAASGGANRDTNLAAALEAIVGAAFVDRGFDQARKLVRNLMDGETERVLSSDVPEDPKSRLQELVQRMGSTLPRYRMVGEEGPDNGKEFEAEVLMDGEVLGRGRGTRKVDAQKQAAREALRRLEGVRT